MQIVTGKNGSRLGVFDHLRNTETGKLVEMPVTPVQEQRLFAAQAYGESCADAILSLDVKQAFVIQEE